MSDNLKNLCVLVTRPEPKGTEICKEIALHGGEVIYFPTIEFAPPIDIEAFEQTVKSLSEQDWLIFMSPQAVYVSIASICKVWPNISSQVKFAVVGKSTANALKHAGFSVDAHPENEWTSEGLLELPIFKDMAGKKVTIIRGEGAKEYLELTLLERGAILTHLVAYHKRMPSLTVKTYLHFVKENILEGMISTSFDGVKKLNVDTFFNLLKQNMVDVIVCTSYEAAKNLKHLMGIDYWQYLQTIPVLVISERMKMLVQELGFHTVWVAENASHHAIIEALAWKRNVLV